MSGWMDSFNQAVGFTDDPEDAKNKAIKAQQSAEDRRATLAEDQFEYQQSLSDPFFKGSLPSYYNLVDAITGQRQTYADPNYTKLSAGDIRAENLRSLQSLRNAGDPVFGKYKDVDLNKHIDKHPNGQGITYDPTKTYYRKADGSITDQAPPMLQSQAFQPTETDAYKWQQQQLDKNTSRSLRSLGRANSTFGMNVMADQNRTLAASEYDRQLGRLADLTNIARGGASSLASASTGFSNQQQQGLTNMGNNVASANLAGGMMKQNSLYNNQSNMMSLANLGLKAYDTWGNKGGGGGDSWGSYNGTIDNYDANTTYAGDSPGPWAG